MNIAVTASEYASPESFPIPASPPDSHADRVVSILGQHPQDWLIRFYRKEYQIKAGCSGEQAADWREQTDLSGSAHSLGEAWLDDLSDFAQLLADLGKEPRATIVLGRLKDESRSPLWNDAGRWHVDDRRNRYEDVPTRLFPVDLDDVECDPLEVGDALADIISTHMPELEGCGYVWAHTGSSGIQGKGTRVRLWFLLEQARHLAAFTAYGRFVNERAGRSIIDAGIYQPGRLVFTADPLLLDAQGNKIRRPVPSGAWHVAGDLVPATAFPDVLPGSAVSSASAHVPPSERLTGVAASGLLSELSPGNYSTNIHRWLCGEAWRAPEHRAEAALQTAIAVIAQRIRETSEPERIEERLRNHADPRKLRMAWNAACDRQRRSLTLNNLSAPVAEVVPPSLGNLKIDTTGAGLLEDLTAEERDEYLDEESTSRPVSVAQARADLLADFKHVTDSVLLKREKGHWLFKHAPGLGKSGGLKHLTTPGSLCSNKVFIRVPDHRLAEQLVRDLQAEAAAQPNAKSFHGDLVARIRHHKGRSQKDMCPDDESRPKAQRAERLGVSPKKAVCPNCKTGQAGLCPWLKQDQDDGCGIIIEAHASAVSINRERRADLTLIDENILTSVVETVAEHVSLTALGSPGSIHGAPNDHGTLGGLRHGATLKMHGHRQDLVAALRAAVPSKKGKAGAVALVSLVEFARPATFEAREGYRTIEREGLAIDEAIELESWLQTSLVQQIDKAEEAGKESSALRAQLKASHAATSLYEAIAASMKCGREYVFGIAAVHAVEGKRRRELVKYATRAADVANIFGDASITMDGTANESVWRTVVSPAGAPIAGGVIDTCVAVDPAAVVCTQYSDKSGSKSSLVKRTKMTDEEQEKVDQRDNLVAAGRWARRLIGPEQYDLDMAVAQTAVEMDVAEHEQRKKRIDANLSLPHRLACFKAAEFADRAVEIGGRRVSVLLVAQMAVGEELKRIGLPDTVAVEHFGKLKGINDYKDVPVAIIAGRPRPADIDLELLTEALHMHDPVVGSIGRYDADPSEGRAWKEVHPDPLVAAVQSQITEANVQQAVARVRVFDRTPAKPVELHVFGQCDTGLPPELVRLARWTDADRSPVEIAAAAGCVFLDQRLNRLAYGTLFPRGSRDGRGRVGRKNKAKFEELVANLARHGTEQRLPVEHEFGLKPNSEVGAGSSGSLLQLEAEFDLQQQQTLVGDALDFSAEGSTAKRRHRLVKLRVPPGNASYAIVGADWTEADVAQLIGRAIAAWVEQTADQVHALNARRIIGVPDNR